MAEWDPRNPEERYDTYEEEDYIPVELPFPEAEGSESVKAEGSSSAIDDFLSEDSQEPMSAINEFMSEEDKEQPQESKLESGLRGTAHGLSLGFLDELSGAAGNVAGKAGLVPDKGYEYYRDYARKRDETSKKANPYSYGSGEIGGGVASMAIPGLNIAKGAKAGKIIGNSALQGGLYGAGESQKNLASEEGLWDVAKGAGMGVVGEGLGQAAGGIVKSVARSPASSKKLAEYLSAKSLGAERGTIKALGRAKVLNAGRYGLDKKIVRPFSSAQGMIDRNLSQQSQAGKKMGEVYSAIDEKGLSTFNPLEVAAKIDEKSGGFWRSPINRDISRQLDNTLESVLMRGDKNIPLSQAQILKEEIGRTANWKNKTPNITEKERMAREAYDVINKAIDDATDKGAKVIGSDDLLKTLQEAKRIYSNSATADVLLNNRFAREEGNSLLGLKDAIIASSNLAQGNPANAAKLVVGKRLMDRFGPSTLAFGVDKVSKILNIAPKSLGRFAPALQEAASRGTKSLIITHNLLLKTNPEYADMIQNIE